MLNWINSNKFFIDEFIYILCGLISILTAFRGLKNKEARIGTFLFWFLVGVTTRSEERRVGKECRSRWSPYH